MEYLKKFEDYKFEPANMKSIRKNNLDVDSFCKNIESENGNIKDIVLTSNGERYLIYYTKGEPTNIETKTIKK